MKTEILAYLKEADDYLSGQQLCEHFHVSRTAVWKAIKSLQEDGYEIEAIRNKGYRLTNEPDILTKESCANEIHTRWAGKCLEVYQEIDSTNIRAGKLGDEGAAHGTLVVADMQTAGKGRRGRGWITPSGTAIAFSLLLRPSLGPERISMVTLVAAVAVSRALDEAAGIQTMIKWPNDIVCDRKKLCGILTEMRAEIEQVHYVVVGVGINVHVTDFPEELREKAASLLTVSGKRCSRSHIVGLIMKYMEEYYDAFEKEGDLSAIRPYYEKKLAGLGDRVCLIDPKHDRIATCLGITDHGALRVKTEEGNIEEIISGEVSVRGLYGYI